MQYDDWDTWGLDWNSPGALEISGGVDLNNNL